VTGLLLAHARNTADMRGRWLDPGRGTGHADLVVLPGLRAAGNRVDSWVVPAAISFLPLMPPSGPGQWLAKKLSRMRVRCMIPEVSAYCGDQSR